MPTPNRPAPLTAVVIRKEQLSETMVRLVLGGEELRQFGANDFADQYVKLVFPQPGQERPLMRTYTVRAWDAATHELTIDFVVHGDEGLAGPWARDAEAGDRTLISGPGGGYSPDPGAAWHPIVGDESAIPAIAAAAEQLREGQVARILIEVHGGEDELPFAVPDGTEVLWLHRGGKERGDLLVDAVTTMDFPDGAPQVFLHGEAGFVRTLRRHLLVERKVPRELAASISGYWRLGRDDEAWRAEKRQWNAASEAEVSA